MKLDNLIEGPQYRCFIFEINDIWTLEKINGYLFRFANLRFIYNIN